ncbi:MAG: electron transfer flavoprotein subunit beta/FixA family protein [Planctomycetes bacterium]|nr:electron transfer flavoprotein subunit beta/FixA family protein [Planctomycetota bacterium]
MSGGGLPPTAKKVLSSQGGEVKLLVTLKRTPQRDARIRISEAGDSLDLDNVQFEVNPFDELAVEEALRIREAGGEVEVVVVTVGGEECQQQLISALAMGADRAVRVESSGQLDSLRVAGALAAVARREEPDLVLAGKLAVDDECGQVPAMMAGLLGWPQANQASSIELSEDASSLRVVCEVDAGLETVTLALPAVVMADLRLNEPRYASLPGIMKAKKKPVEVLALDELGDAGSTRSRVTGFRALEEKPPGVRLDTVEELVRALEERKLV